MARILFLTHQMPSPFGGGTAVSYWTLRELARRGWQVGLVTFVEAHRAQAPPPEGLEGVEILARVPLVYRNTPGALLRSLRGPVPFTTQKYLHPAFGEAVARAVQAFRPQVLFADHTHMAPAALRAAGGFARVLRVHNAEHVLWHQTARYTRHPVKRAVLAVVARRVRRFEEATYPLFDRVLFLSDRDRQRFPDLPRAVTLPPGVDTAYFTPQPVSPHRRNLVFVGSLDWLPNVDGIRWFVRAVWPRLQARDPALHLWIVGKNPPPAVARLAGSAVTVTGFVPDIRTYVRQGGLFIVPLRIGSGLRIKILEALAQGIPVVTTRVGAAGLEHLAPAYRLADTPEEWEAAVLDLLNRPDEYETLRRWGPELVARYHRWPAIVERLEQVLRPLLREPVP